MLFKSRAFIKMVWVRARVGPTPSHFDSQLFIYDDAWDSSDTCGWITRVHHMQFDVDWNLMHHWFDGVKLCIWLDQRVSKATLFAHKIVHSWRMIKHSNFKWLNQWKASNWCERFFSVAIFRLIRAKDRIANGYKNSWWFWFVASELLICKQQHRRGGNMFTG